MRRDDYAADPTLLGQVFELLAIVFGAGFATTATQGERWGLRWDRCSTPFVRREQGRVVAHVGVMDIPVVLDGVHGRVAAVHAVAVHPQHRGRGLMRELLTEALEWCDARFKTCALAGDPALYQRFGFRHLREHRFVGPAPPGVVPAADALRLCSADDPVDVARWQRLLRERMPVSKRAAIAAEPHVFAFDASRVAIHYSPALDALLYFDCEGRTLRLYDVVAAHMPSLAEIVVAVGRPVERAEVYFTADGLRAELTAEPWDLGEPDDPDAWMVRGPWTTGPFMWPRTARW